MYVLILTSALRIDPLCTIVNVLYPLSLPAVHG